MILFFNFVSQGDVIGMVQLLDEGVFINFFGYDKRIVIYLVVSEGYVVVVELLLLWGVDVNFVDCWGDIVSFLIWLSMI